MNFLSKVSKVVSKVSNVSNACTSATDHNNNINDDKMKLLTKGSWLMITSLDGNCLGFIRLDNWPYQLSLADIRLFILNEINSNSNSKQSDKRFAEGFTFAASACGSIASQAAQKSLPKLINQDDETFLLAKHFLPAISVIWYEAHPALTGSQLEDQDEDEDEGKDTNDSYNDQFRFAAAEQKINSSLGFGSEDRDDDIILNDDTKHAAVAIDKMKTQMCRTKSKN